MSVGCSSVSGSWRQSSARSAPVAPRAGYWQSKARRGSARRAWSWRPKSGVERLDSGFCRPGVRARALVLLRRGPAAVRACCGVALSAEEQADSLAGAASLAATLFDPAQVAAEPAGNSSLATLHGLYWLTVNLAARSPLVAIVDDLHWCDLASLRWLAYLLPRMEGLAVSVVVGLRPQDPGEHRLMAQILSDPLAAALRPAPLSVEATARLMDERRSRRRPRICSAPLARRRQAAIRCSARARRRGRG